MEVIAIETQQASLAARKATVDIHEDENNAEEIIQHDNYGDEEDEFKNYDDRCDYNTLIKFELKKINCKSDLSLFS